MIICAHELVNDNVINFGTAKAKTLGKVTLVASLNPQMKTIEGVCLKTGEALQLQEVNKQPVCVFDSAYVANYLRD